MIELVLNQMYNSPSFGEMLKLLKNHPNVIDKMNNQTVKLNDNDIEIFNLVSQLPQEQKDVIINYYSMKPQTSTPKSKSLTDVLKSKSGLFPEKEEYYYTSRP